MRKRSKVADKFVRLSDVEDMLSKANTVVHYNSYYETMESGYLEDDIDLSQLPLADVVSVVHAHWVSKGQGAKRCSVCGQRREFFNWNFCPNCGAKMDKEVKEDA